MIVVADTGIEYTIHFKHLVEGNKRRTLCSVYRGRVTKEELKGNVNPIAFGVSKCNPKDVFKKEIGRRRSLTKALAETPAVRELNKQLRTLIWNTYKEWGIKRF